MTDRLLPVEEWGRLAGTELESVIATLDPKFADVAVVENEHGEIVGCWALLTILHGEGVWIAPAYRGKTSVAVRLWKRMAAMVKARGARSIVTAAANPVIEQLLTRRRAHKIPAQEYVVCLHP